MSGSVSPLPWTGSKGCIYTTIDAFMPPHKTYVEACMGSAEVFLRKKPSEREIINDYNGDLVKFFRVLQRSEKLAYLLGRLYGKAYCCQPVGFVEVPFDESKTMKPDNLMRVVYVEPNKPPYMAEIEHTLEAEQKAVQGLIEVVYPHNGDDVCFICNEEGKLIGMEGNRTIHDGNTILAGPFFICGLTEDDFRGLTDEEVTKYMEVFKEPEQISQAEVEADMGYTIISGI